MSPLLSLTMNDLIKPYLAIVIGTAIGFAGCVVLQKHLNAVVIKKCPSIYTIAYARSAMGDIAYCKSRAKFYGPATPLND